MMHAIVKVAGFQFRVEEGAVIRVPLHSAKPGDRVEVGDVLLLQDGTTAHIGRPFVAGAKIEAEVVQHGKGEKMRSGKYKRRTKYRRTLGHRQDFTELKIARIITPKA